jgi:DNA-directed RNA polymerase subunit RPC12/RpoP
MFIDPKIQNRLTPSVQHMVLQLGEKEQQMFWMQFPSQSKDPTVMTLLAVFFPIQFFLLGQIGLGVAFILTGYGCCVWWVIEWFLAASRTRKYNDTIALTLIQGIQMSRQSGQTFQNPEITAPPPPPSFGVVGTTYTPPLAAIPVQINAKNNSEIKCDNCKQIMTLPGDLNGQAVQCPHCSALVKK